MGDSSVPNALLWLGHGLPGTPRAGDRASVAAFGDLLLGVVGIPGRDANGRKDSGAALAHGFADPGDCWLGGVFMAGWQA